jgi:hypothetical protein
MHNQLRYNIVYKIYVNVHEAIKYIYTYNYKKIHHLFMSLLQRFLIIYGKLNKNKH